MISFAGGLPSPLTFPVDAMRGALDRVLTNSGREALQYSTTEGYAPLREWIAARVGTPEAPVSPDEVLIAFAVATRGRLHARLGGLHADRIAGQDGLR